MKVVAILGGLGSQMFKYAFYLNVKEHTKDQNCYVDTTLFDKLDMWNGYELKNIFNIDVCDVKEIFTKEEYLEMIQADVPHRTFILNKMIDTDYKTTYLFNRGIRTQWKFKRVMKHPLLLKLKQILRQLKSILYEIKVKKDKNYIKNMTSCEDKYDDAYLCEDANAYYDEFNHTSDLYVKKIKLELIRVFKFPPLIDKKNIELANIISNTNAVAMHIRRSDHMYDNGQLFENHYYKKCVDLIKSKVENCSFFIFSDEPEWCKKNLTALGLNIESGQVYFVDWNIGNESYRDMQLMTLCKHNILAISAFSWWGYYLSEIEDKIVCAPNGYWLEVQYHF